MKPSCKITHFYQTLMAICMLGCLLAGCTAVGPSAIRSGRVTYNEAIAETNNQQMLMSVIHHRYEEIGSLLTVTSIAANVSVTTSTGIQLGFGDKDNFAGNLVPFSAGAVYEENPTIAYAPVAGAEYVRQVYSPIPLSLLVQMTGALADSANVYKALVSNVNGIQNPDFLFAHTSLDPRFSRFVAITTKLTQANRLHWAESPRQPGSFPSLLTTMRPPIQPRFVSSWICWDCLPQMVALHR